ncbi:S-adenosyl-L-methionine-dependent methyltransferase [Schizopora paradoxa]|uniref:S-adenosyl-L-methionine-dependent methyltransferase n=1 Tax=Schizopora paradoxa TaxID=27342 RepID=A0A0H2R9D4_9AGAM|nr:S-adenosyl-L-methionine-dependent methyltransferase [Schizopora paradoxa]
MPSSNEADPYFLPRGDIEFERLNKQHVIYTKHVYDNRLVFDETIALHETDCVLDAGAGTCIWSIDLSREVPESVQIYATDISAGSFPPVETMPSNVHTSIASSTSFPPEWSNKFTLVHQRLLFGGLRESEWPVAISEMFRILKPGGAIQLMEVRISEPVGPSMAEFDGILVEFFKKRGLLHDIDLRLEVLAADAGFTHITAKKKDVLIGRKWAELGESEYLQDLKPLVGGLVNLSPALLGEGLIRSDAEYRALLVEMEKEWDAYGNRFWTALLQLEMVIRECRD